MKIGDYTIPHYRLQDLIEDAKKIYDKFPNEAVDSELIAHAIGYKPTGGAFKQRLTDLRLYGLIEGRGKIKVSELGKIVTYGHEIEKTDALEKIIKHVPLWSIFFDKYKVNIKEKDFWIDLVQITHVERPDAQTKADSIRKAYMEDVKYLKPVENTSEISNSISQLSEIFNSSEKNLTNQNKESKSIPFNIENDTVNTIGYIGFPEYSKAPIEIKDEISYNIAKQLLEAIGNKLKEKNLKDKSESIIIETSTTN